MIESSVQKFFTAIKKGHLMTVSDLLKENPKLLTSQDENGSSALLIAAYYQQPAIIELLVKNDPPMNIFEACSTGSLKKVSNILIEHPDQVNVFASDGFQPIGLAAFFGHKDVVITLIDHGAELDTPSRNNLGVTPLNSATAGNHIEIVRLLLTRGANPNTPQADGFIPLHAAAQNGNKEMVELLLSYGADPKHKNHFEKSAYDIAIESGHLHLGDLLK